MQKRLLTSSSLLLLSVMSSIPFMMWFNHSSKSFGEGWTSSWISSNSPLLLPSGSAWYLCFLTPAFSKALKTDWSHPAAASLSSLCSFCLLHNVLAELPVYIACPSNFALDSHSSTWNLNKNKWFSPFLLFYWHLPACPGSWIPHRVEEGDQPPWGCSHRKKIQNLHPLESQSQSWKLVEGTAGASQTFCCFQCADLVPSVDMHLG